MGVGHDGHPPRSGRPPRQDDAAEIARLKTDLLTAPRADRKPGTRTVTNARGRWKRLERRDSFSSPWQPAWLQGLIGDEYFQEVTSVALHGETTDDQLAHVKYLDQIADLKLGDAKHITDAGARSPRRPCHTASEFDLSGVPLGPLTPHWRTWRK